MKALMLCFIFVAVTPNLNSFAFEIPKLHPKLFLNFFKSKAGDILEKSGVKSQCASDLRSLIEDVVFGEKWALMMLDASGKLPSGVLNGNFHIIGNFDECISIRQEKLNHIIDGQYCTVVLMPSSHFSSEFTFLLDSVALTNYVGYNISYHTADIMKSIKMTFGVCIPKSCYMGHLQKIWDYVEHTFGIPVHVHVFDILCIHKDKPVEPFDIDQYVYAAFGVYIVIILASTWYDLMIYQHIKEKQHHDNYWIAFSVYENARKLFSYNKTPTDDHLHCINGIKVLSIVWIIFGHRILWNVFSGNINSLYALQWKQNMENTFIIGAFLAVDSFFLLSGFLLSYGYLKYKSTITTGKSMSLTAFYSLRFLRLSPALLATVLFYISVFKRLSDGPAWPAISKKFASSCRHTWWATLFFISNLFDIKHQCVEQSWYVAVDTQLYLISPIILFNLEKRPWKTCLACLGACIVSAVYAFIITVQNKYAVFFFEGNRAYQQYIYTPTFVRMPPWLIGMVLGYLVFRYKRIHIPQGANLFLWASSLSLMTYIIMVQVVLTRNEYNAYNAAVYNSCVRPAWALALALIVFSCVTGHGGVINEFLSLPIFQVAVRLSYSMYLVHVAVQAYFIGSRRNLDHFANIKGVHDFMGDMFFVSVVSIVWVLAFESPFMAISKIVLSKVRNTEVVSSKKRNKNYEVCVYYNKKKSLRKLSK